MGDSERSLGNKRFGSFLRKVRERKRLSLDAVEEMSAAYPGRVTKSHLSRIENGHAIPTFPRLVALGRIYGVPVSTLAERFELDLQYVAAEERCRSMSDDEVLGEAKRMVESGRYTDSLALFTLLVDRLSQGPVEEPTRRRLIDLRIHQIDSLVHLSCYESAKAECEELLGEADCTREQRVYLFQIFAISCHRMGRHAMGLMGLEQAEREMSALDGGHVKTQADFHSIRGNILNSTGQHEEAAACYARAIDLYAGQQDAFNEGWAKLNLADSLIELGRLDEAGELASAVSRVADSLGYDRQLATALSHLAAIAYRERDYHAAEAFSIRSNAIARPREYLKIVFRNCYYLWQVAQQTGDAAGVKLNERTLRSYLGRIGESIPEAEVFRTVAMRGES